MKFLMGVLNCFKGLINFTEPDAVTFIVEDLHEQNVAFISAQIEQARNKNKEIRKQVHTHDSTAKNARLKHHKLSANEINKWNDEIIREYVSKLWIRKSSTDQIKKQLNLYTGADAYANKERLTNTIRHRYTNYDSLRKYAFNDLYRDDAQLITDILKYESFELMKRFYPNLIDACDSFQNTKCRDLSKYMN